MGWQNTLVVIIQQFEPVKHESKRSIRTKITTVKKYIDKAFTRLPAGTPRIHPKFITIKDKSWPKKEQPKDWKDTLHKKMRETCSPSGMEAFDIMFPTASQGRRS